MLRHSRSPAWPRMVFLIGALPLLIRPLPARAQTCPSVSLSITRITAPGYPTGPNQQSGLTGNPEVVFSQSGTIDYTQWLYQYQLSVFSADGTLVWQTVGTTGSLPSGESYFDWITTGMRRPYSPQSPLTGALQPANGAFKVQVELDLKPKSNPSGPWTCPYPSSKVSAILTQGAPVMAEIDPADKLNMVCTDQNHPEVQGMSETDPQTGDESWSIPVTSWPYHGNTYGLTLSYASVGMTDPNNPDLLNLAGLSQKNSHWTHNFASWLTLPIDASGAGWAVVHRPGETLDFKQPASGNVYTPLASFDSLTASSTLASPGPTVTYPCNGQQVPQQISPAPPNYFTLTDRDGTLYRFGGTAAGGNGPIYQISECTALPVYLLTSITDRWNREVDITWTDVLGTGMGWRVTQVSNPGSTTALTLSYSSTTGLMQSARLSSDPAGVNALALVYTGVLDENSVSQQKLTTVTVNGPAAAASRTRTWSFVYRDPATENTAYSGTVTGDLVIRKTRPDGLTVSYTYEAVTLPRVTSADFDGRFVSASWTDSSEGTNVTRSIARQANGNTVTFTSQPDGLQTQYVYSGADLTSLTELANTPAARTWTYQYDSWHNLTALWSPREPTTGTALVQNAYTEDSSGHISHVTTTVPIANGTGTTTISTETDYNSYNLPTKITASHDPDPNAYPIGLANFPHYQDQVTTFGYDEGLSPALGNLTSITRTDDSGQNWVTQLLYDTPQGVYGPPGHVINDVGGESAFTYDSLTGLLTSAASPLNTVVGSGSPDYPASVTQITGYENHGLPTQVVDPAGRTTTTAFQAPASQPRT